MKAAIYSRKSKFTGKGESIENQVQLCKEYGKKIGVTEFAIYEDEGFTGSNTKRPEFQRLVKDIKSKKFNVLMCYRLDRISRNVADFSAVLNILEQYNVSFISINEHFDTSNPMGKAMIYIASVFAQLERETIAERIRDNMLMLARTGRWLGGKTPTGFKSEAIEYLDENMNKKKMYKLSPITEELKLVKLLYDKYLELGSLTRLESYCLSNNIKTRNNHDFDKSTLRFILTNPVYAVADRNLYEYCINNDMVIANSIDEFNGNSSVMVFNKRKVSKGEKSIVAIKDTSEWIVAIAKHKGIISSKAWITTQNILEENKDKAPREGTSKYALLTPLLICGNCGSKMRVTGKYINKKLRHHYYKCTMKANSNGTRCSIPNLHGLDAEEALIRELKTIVLNKNTIIKQLEYKIKKLQEDAKESLNEKEKIYLKQKDLERLIENLTVRLAENLNSAATNYIMIQIEKLDSELKELKSRLSDIENTSYITYVKKISIESFQEQLKVFAERFDLMDFHSKKKLLQKIIKKIVWDGKTLKIHLLTSD